MMHMFLKGLHEDMHGAAVASLPTRDVVRLSFN
jgi:hypothetical protein